jgi:large subunit ribosomal protein L32
MRYFEYHYVVKINYYFQGSTMPVPKRKRSRARRDKRFANKGIKVKATTSCQQCAAPLVPHVLCQGCGFYKGRKIITTKLDRTQKRIETSQVKKQASAGARSQKSPQESE